MGITIHYKGYLRKNRINELVKFLERFCKKYGLKFELVKNVDVEGIIVDLNQGCDPVRFVFNKTGLMKEFTKTQFSGLKGHLKVIAILEAVRDKFIPDLQVKDESGFWETRNFENLRQEFTDMTIGLDQVVDKLKSND